MTDKLRDALTQAIQAVVDEAELDATVASLPEAYATELAEVIDAKRAEFAPETPETPETRDEEAPSPLADVTAAELAELLLARPELRDALSALLVPPAPEPATPDPATPDPVTLTDENQTTGIAPGTTSSGTWDTSTIFTIGSASMPPFTLAPGGTMNLVPAPEPLAEDSVEAALAQLVDEAKDRVSEDFHGKLLEALVPQPAPEPAPAPAAPELEPALLETLRDTAERLGIESSEMSASQLIAEIDQRVTSLPGNAGHNRITRERRVADAAFSRLLGR